MENQETVKQEEAVEKTFTQAELDAIVTDRLKRERTKYEGFEDFKAKAMKLDEIEEANKSELDKAHERVSTLEAELSSLKKAAEIRAMREKVASETGVPMNLLTAETEEDCIEQANAIKAFAIPTGYPVVKDGGEVQHIGKQSTKQQFAEWANKAFN